MSKSSRGAPIRMFPELNAMKKLPTEQLREISVSKRAGKHRRHEAQRLLYERGER